jgi:hypothetical protein
VGARATLRGELAQTVADVGGQLAAAFVFRGAVAEQFLDALVPPLPPLPLGSRAGVAAVGLDSTTARDEFGGGGGAGGDARGDAPVAVFDAQYLAAFGLPAVCSRAEVQAADRRALRARALISSAAVLFLLASLLRVLTSSVGKARARGRLRALPRVLAAQASAAAKAGVAGAGPSEAGARAEGEGRLKAA